MEDDDIDLLLALQPDDAESDEELEHRAADANPQVKPTANKGKTSRAPVPERSPPRANGPPSRAYHSPEADKAPPPRAKVSLSAAFGREEKGPQNERKQNAAPAKESQKEKVHRILDNADHIEVHSGLRIKNRLLPSIIVKDKFTDVRFLRLDKISSSARGDPPAAPWATVGVLSEKMPPREGSSGKKYGLWKITNLAGFTCSLFLFGEAFEAHWKESEGSIIGLLNAKYKAEDDSGRSSAPFSLSADRSQQVFKLGTSMDLGLCQGTRKDGMPCTMPINKSEGDCCQYHAAGAYQKLQKLQKAQEKGHRIDLGQGKLSREPHGRVLNNVYVSAAPVALPPIKKRGKDNFLQPGHMQEMAELEFQRRAHSQGSRQAMALAATMRQQQEKAAEKELKKELDKGAPRGAGPSKTHPTAAPLKANATAAVAKTGTVASAAAKMTSALKPVIKPEGRPAAGKENRVAGATLGLDERERKRQQLERNRVRAEGNGTQAVQKRNGTQVGAERNGAQTESKRNGTQAGAERKMESGKGGLSDADLAAALAMAEELEADVMPTPTGSEATQDDDVVPAIENQSQPGGSSALPVEPSSKTKAGMDGRTNSEPKTSSDKVSEKGESRTVGNLAGLGKSGGVGKPAKRKLTDEELAAVLGAPLAGSAGSLKIRVEQKGEANQGETGVKRPSPTGDGRSEEKRLATKGVVMAGGRNDRTESAEREERNCSGAENGRKEPSAGGENKSRPGVSTGLGVGGSGTGKTAREVGKSAREMGESDRGAGDRAGRTEGTPGANCGKKGAANAHKESHKPANWWDVLKAAAERDPHEKLSPACIREQIAAEEEFLFRNIPPEELVEWVKNSSERKRAREQVLSAENAARSLKRRPVPESSEERPKAQNRQVPTGDGTERHVAAEEGSGRHVGAAEPVRKKRREEGASGKGVDENMAAERAGGVSGRKRPSIDGVETERNGKERTENRAERGGTEGRNGVKGPEFKRFKTGTSQGSDRQTGVEKRAPTGADDMTPRGSHRTADKEPRYADMKRRITEGCRQLTALEREELIQLLRSTNEVEKTVNAGQRIKKVSATSGGERPDESSDIRHVAPRGKPAAGHVAGKAKDFAAAFRDVAGVDEGPRESVFKDMGDLEEIEHAVASFDVLQKKEELAAKMDKIHSVTVKGWRCDQCRRATEKKPELCVSDGHTIRFATKLVKRFFACAECKERTDTLGREYPEHPCKKCRGQHFKPTGMAYKVPTKETPFAAKENFLARGKEHKFSLRDE